MKSVAVIGASLAGLRAVETLRGEGFEGALHLIGDEGALPYDRPPLSKQVLSGEWDSDRVRLVSAEALGELQVTQHLGDPAASLDADARRVTLASGVELDVDGVVIATGARTRTIETDLQGVHTLRTRGDAEAIAKAFDGEPSRVAVVGGGFIGAEVAATARGRGIDVTIIEMSDTPFQRVLGAEVGGVIADLHRDQGVDLRTGVGCAGFQGGGGSIEAVELTDLSLIHI